jgi:thiamine biosynthesis lipoprotein
VGDARYTCSSNSPCLADEAGTFVLAENIAPTEEQIQQAKLCTPTYENIENYIVVNDEDNTITINQISGCNSSISITLGALAKSYATEKIAKNSTIRNGDFMLNAGQSTIKILGENLSRDTGEWNVGVTDSYLVYSRGNNFASYLMKISDAVSISTSSGDEKHYFSNGNYYHHIIDPISGYPNQQRLAITAVMENAMYADIITTSLMSMTMEETIKYLNTLKSNGIEVELFIQDKGENGPVLYATSNLKQKISIRDNESLTSYLDSLVIEEFNYVA